MENLWYKNAITYAIDVHRFQDATGDGCGDFAGLTDRLDYLADLGVTCLWLLPFYPSPSRDNGYDVANHRQIDSRLGTFDDFERFLHAAGERSMRVIVDLVMDHTSDEHPWFRAARRSDTSHYRDYYIWTDDPPPTPPGKGPMFPGQESTVWTYDEAAGQYYYHRFYAFEPDLNPSNPDVQDEIRRVIDFWLAFGVSGFRVDAANHLIEMPETQRSEPERSHEILRRMREITDVHKPDAVLLGEADEPPEQLTTFFGDDDQLHMLFNFVLNNYLFLALARQEGTPIAHALKRLPHPPPTGQWANFMRNLDELDLERLPEADREEVLEAFAPDEDMRIFGRGVRRRMAPMLGDNRRRLEMAFSLLFSLPGAPVIVYGDEIGMGEDLTQTGRNAVRAPMQWSDEQNAGFSTADADDLIQPVIDSGPFAYESVNVAAQRDAPDSMLNIMKRLIHVRRQCPEIGYGTWKIFDVDVPAVFAHRCVWKDRTVVAVHNLSDTEQTVTLDLHDQRGRKMQSLLETSEREFTIEGDHEETLAPFAYKWYRIKGSAE